MSEFISPGIGFKTSPNLGAARLEKCLGIDYPNKPNSIQLTPWNQVALALNALSYPSYTALLFSTSIAGMYVPESHTYFFKRSGQHIDDHENMHGYIYTYNPKVAEYIVDKHTRGISAVLDSGSNGKDDLINKFVSECFDEGLCEYAAMLSCLTSGGTAALGAISRRRIMTASFGTGELKSTSSKVQKMYDYIEAKATEYTQKKLSFSLKKATILSKAMDLRELSYVLGYIFIQDAMKHLTIQGLKTPESVNFLIDHYPTSMDDLRDPKRFVKKII